MDAQSVGDRYERGGLFVDGSPLVALASALASSLAESGDPAQVVVRDSGAGLIGVVGFTDPARSARFSGLNWQVHSALDRLRYIGPDQVESACDILADCLKHHFGQSDLTNCQFISIPNGGIHVLTRLTERLGLDDQQLNSPVAQGRPLVLVDDCAISGLRVKETLAEIDGPVVFAHLFSHPDLRDAIIREPGVEACLAAGDLEDHAPGTHEAGYPTWRRRWEARQRERRLWVGLPDHVCFPWNEPDIVIWNPETRSEERAWRVVPPSHCTKNQPSGGVDLPLFVQPEGPGPLRVSERALFCPMDANSVVLARLGNPTAVTLENTAAETWRALVQSGSIDRAVPRLEALYGVPAPELRPDVERLTADLTEAGFLTGSTAQHSVEP